MNQWTAGSIPNQTGRVVIITGANSGLGYESTLALVRKGAQVIMANRDARKSEAAQREILRQVPNALIDILSLDLANLESIRAFADAFKAKYARLDVLLNNAGVMGAPYRKTADGFEMHMGINHLGHFALTGVLLDRLIATPDSRVVTVSSGAAAFGSRLKVDDLNRTRGYYKWFAYGESKLANLLFTVELQRRLTAAGLSSPIAVAAHPGYAATNLQTAVVTPLEGVVMSILNRTVAQSAEMGALPQLYAATALDVRGGDYYGPQNGMRGYPAQETMSAAARDAALARRLWEVSESMTGVRFAALDAVRA